MDNPFQRAKDAGYSDEEVINFLESSPQYKDKINKAREFNYSNDEIFNFLSTPQEQAIQSDQQQPQQEESAFRKYVDKPFQYITQPVPAAIESLPRTLFDTSLGVRKALGIKPGMIEAINEKSPKWLKEAAKFAFPTYEEARGEEIYQHPVLRGLEKGQRFLGESLVSGPARTAKGVASLLGAAGGAQLGEELDLNPFSKAALTMGSSLLAGKLSGAKEAFKQRPTNDVERYIQASREIGVDPLLTGMNPTQLQKVAQKWATHGYGGDQILLDAYRSRSGQIANAFENALDSTSRQIIETPLEAGVTLQSGLRDATRQVEANKSQLYRAIDRTYPDDASIQVPNPSSLERTIGNAVDNLSDTLNQSHPESATYRRGRALETQLERLLEETDSNIPIRTLEATNRSLNDFIRYQTPGGADKLLVPFAREIRNLLDQYGRTNPQYAQARQAANDYFANDVVHIRQNLLQSIVRSERPESTLAIMNNVSGIRNVKRALDSLPHGDEIFNSLRRYKLSDLIRDKIIDPSTGLMKVGGLSKFLSKKSSDYPYIRELSSPETFRILNNLEHVGTGLEKGFNALVNPSRTADTLLAIQSVVSPGKKVLKGLKEASKGKIIEGAFDVTGGIVEALAPRVLARIILDPEFARRIYRLSNAGRARDWKTFNAILDQVDSELKKEEKDTLE